MSTAGVLTTGYHGVKALKKERRGEVRRESWQHMRYASEEFLQLPAKSHGMLPFRNIIVL